MPESDVVSAPPKGGFGCLLRIYWMFAGCVAPAYAAVIIAREGEGQPGVADAVFALGLITLLAARFVDIRSYNGKTGEGAPATMADFRRYAVGVVLIGLAVYGGAQALARLL
ncbi:MAG: hypothetical protein M5U26_00600 [Planctomycetota bacterium]|nr:hypothetical protein [Planctomycetota bacterium]